MRREPARAWVGVAMLVAVVVGVAVVPSPVLAGPIAGAALAASTQPARDDDSVVAGNWASCFLDSGRAYCWGYQNGPRPSRVDTYAVAGRLVQLVIGGGYTCGLSNQGRAYCWGANESGQLGDGTTTPRPTPVPVDTAGALAGVRLVALSAGGFSTCGLSDAGRAYCWGSNYHGTLGDGSTVDRSAPVAVDRSGVLAGVQLVRIATAGGATCALSAAGHAYCWGYNGNGGLGDGTTTSRSTPGAVDTSGALAEVRLVQIAEGGDHACALASNALAYCWGRNDLGQLGDGSTTDRSTPVAVPARGALAGVRVAAITTGYLHTCALTAAGHAACWGDNAEGGELGDGSGSGLSTVPVAVSTAGVLRGITLTMISAANFHTCALASLDRVYCWGYNGSGEIGDGTTEDRPTPVRARLPINP